MFAKQYDWTPGNGTFYDLILSKPNEDEYVLCWMRQGGSGGNAFRFRTESHIFYSYLMEKMDIREGDTPGILSFMEELGVSVTYPYWFEKESLNQETYQESFNLAFGT